MIFKTISTLAEYATFLQNFKIHSGGVIIPEDYLQDSYTVAGFKDDEMVCGYIFAPGPKMRWPLFISRNKVSRSLPLHKTMELNGVWLDKKHRKGPLAARLWIQIGKDIGSKDFDYITYSVDSRKKGLIKLYRPIVSGTLYSGPPNPLVIPHVELFWSRRWRFQVLQCFYAAGLMKRFFLSRVKT